MPSLDKLLLFGLAPSLRMKVLNPPSATAEDSPVNLQGTQDPHSQQGLQLPSLWPTGNKITFTFEALFFKRASYFVFRHKTL